MAGRKARYPCPKEEDLATELHDLKNEVMSGHYEVPANEVAEAVLFWHFGRPTDLFWAYGIPTQQQRDESARKAAR
jgi:hypothetical protein